MEFWPYATTISQVAARILRGEEPLELVGLAAAGETLSCHSMPMCAASLQRSTKAVLLLGLPSWTPLVRLGGFAFMCHYWLPSKFCIYERLHASIPVMLRSPCHSWVTSCWLTDAPLDCGAAKLLWMGGEALDDMNCDKRHWRWVAHWKITQGLRQSRRLRYMECRVKSNEPQRPYASPM